MEDKQWILKVTRRVGTVIYVVASIVLTIYAICMIITSFYQIYDSFKSGHSLVDSMLDGVSLLVISIAILDVGKYFFEEEVLRSRELRAPREARRTLTKFLVIIIIAVLLETLVYIFEAGKENMHLLVYPAILLFAATFLIVGLGLFQRLSIQTEKEDIDT